MRHRIAVLFALTFVVGIGIGAWLFVTGPLAEHFRTRAEANFGMLAVMAVCIAIMMGILVSVWQPAADEPHFRKPRHIHFRRMLHH